MGKRPRIGTFFGPTKFSKATNEPPKIKFLAPPLHYTPEQNGRAERSMRTICEAARTMIYAKNFPKSLWAEAVSTVVFSLNYTGNSGKVCKTPCELWFDKIPKIEKFVEFGINAYSLVPKQRRKKWNAKNRKGYFFWIFRNFKRVSYSV